MSMEVILLSVTKTYLKSSESKKSAIEFASTLASKLSETRPLATIRNAIATLSLLLIVEPSTHLHLLDHQSSLTA